MDRQISRATVDDRFFLFDVREWKIIEVSEEVYTASHYFINNKELPSGFPLSAEIVSSLKDWFGNA